MFETFAIFFTQVFGVLLPATVLVVAAIGAVRAGLAVGRVAYIVLALSSLFGLWYATIFALAPSGFWMPPLRATDPPVALLPLIGGTLVLFGLGRWTPDGRKILQALEVRDLITIQVFRLMGGLFLVGWFTGDIPWQFALPAGVGDLLAGLAAIRALRAFEKGDPNAQALARRASLIGIADFAVAVSTGIMTSPGFLHVMAFDTPNIINAHPLALFPEFFVPIFLALQLFALAKLNQPNQPKARSERKSQAAAV